MISIHIPGHGHLEIGHLVLDYNGTLAIDGRMDQTAKKILQELSSEVEIHIVTADTFGSAREEVADLDCQFVVLNQQCQDVLKREYVAELGSSHVLAIGNGRNDRLMVKEAAVGLAVLREEGAFSETMLHSDVICTHIVDALNLMKHPTRLIATLRN